MNVPLMAIRVGLVRGMIGAQQQFRLRTSSEETIRSNLETGTEQIAMIGVGNEPLVVQLARTCIPFLTHREVTETKAAEIVRQRFPRMNRLVGALLYATPINRATPVLPDDLASWVPEEHQQSAGALAVFFDRYFKKLTSYPSLQHAALAISSGVTLSRKSADLVKIFAALGVDPSGSEDLSVKRITRTVEEGLIRMALEKTCGDRDTASQLLEIPSIALNYKIRDYGITDAALVGDPKIDEIAFESLSLKKALRVIEETLIKRALQKTQGNRSQAAQLLEMSHRALLYKIKEYGI